MEKPKDEKQLLKYVYRVGFKKAIYNKFVIKKLGVIITKTKNSKMNDYVAKQSSLESINIKRSKGRYHSFKIFDKSISEFVI